MALFPQPFCGYQRVTTSGAIGSSGKALIFYGYSVLSGAAVGTPTFFDGTGTTGTAVVVADPSNGAANKERTIPLPVGTTFQNGCYVSFDANTSAVTVFYTHAF